MNKTNSDITKERNTVKEVVEYTISNKEDALLNELKKQIPKQATFNIPKETSATEKISSINKNAEKAIINAYIKEEDNRLKRQKPIMFFVSVLLALQLIAFNGIMVVLLVKSFPIISENPELFSALLNFLQYYVGAVVVELVGLMILITKNTFNSRSWRNMEKIIPNKINPNK